jgi:hypothetical protein
MAKTITLGLSVVGRVANLILPEEAHLEVTEK